MVLATAWAKKGIIKLGELKSYQYGLELLLSTIVNLSIIFAISILLESIVFFLFYLWTFIPIRLCAGGYHAKSHAACITINAILFLIAIIIFQILTPKLCLCSSVVSLVIILHFAPIQAKNKPLLEHERIRSRYTAICFTMAIVFFALFFYNTELLNKPYIKAAFCGQISATLLMVFGKASIK